MPIGVARPLHVMEVTIGRAWFVSQKSVVERLKQMEIVAEVHGSEKEWQL